MPVRHATDDFLLTVSLNPARRQLREVLRSVLSSPHPRYRHVIYSGLALGGTGCWLLRDGPFTYNDFVSVLVATKDNQHAPVCVSTFDDGRWTKLAQAVPGLEVVLNPEGKLPSPPESFIESLSRRVGVIEGGTLLGETETVGSMAFARPTVYIFPGGDGASSLFFGIRDLSVICDAGVGRRPAFWDFARHLSHVDVLIGSHSGANNIFGLRTFIERQCSSELQLLPKLGHVIFNGSPDAATTRTEETRPTLLIHLPEEISKVTDMLHDIGILPHICASPAGGKTVQKISLYQKINQGSVDLYVAHPVEDSRELKEFRRQCLSHDPNFSSPGAVPLTSMVSIVAALVWKPCASTEKLVRIFLPGSAPLGKLYEALDRLQGLPLFDSSSGSAEEQAPRAAQHATKPGGTKPAGKPIGASQKPPPSAVKSSAPVKGKDQTGRSVTSPKGNREAANRRSVTKTEPAGKLGRVAKPPQSMQPLSADVKVKHAPVTAASSKVQASVKNSTVDVELPAEVDEPVRVETVHDVNRDEPGTPGLEEIVSRDSAERDSLEPSVTDDVAVDKELLAEVGETAHDVKGDEPAVSGLQEIVSRDDSAERDSLEPSVCDDDVPVEDIDRDHDVDDRIIPSLYDAASTRLDVSSSGNCERVGPLGELETVSSSMDVDVVAEPDEPLADDVPLCEAVHSGLADVIAEDEDASQAKETGLDEVADKQSAAQQETDQELEPVEGTAQQGVGCEFDGDLLSSMTMQTTKPIPDEHAVELGYQGKTEDVDEVDIEPDEGALRGNSQIGVGHEIDGNHSSGLLSDLQQSAAAHSTEPDLGDAADEPCDQGQLKAVKPAYIEASQELMKEMDAVEEAATADSGIIPQGLPSPQKEAEWLETEQVDPEMENFRGEAADVGRSVDDGEVIEDSAAAAPEDDVSDEVQQHRDILETGELEDLCQENTDSTLCKPAEDPTEMPDLQSEVQYSEDDTVSTGLLPDQKTEEIADAAVHSNLEPEVISPDVTDKLSPDIEEPMSEKELPAEELQSVTQEESVPLAADPEAHIHGSDQPSEKQELPSAAATTGEFDDDRVPESPKEQELMETSEQPVHEEYPLETEPSSFSITAPHEQITDDFQRDTDMPDTIDAADDVPVSPVEQHEELTESKRTSFYYTEPEIQLTEDADRASDMELPAAVTDLATLTNDGQSDVVEQPHTQEAAAEEPFDPIQSWGSPMGLPAPLNNDNKESGKKRESKGDAAHGAAASTKDRSFLSASKTDAKTTSSGKTGATRDLSGGRNGRTSAKPGKPAERPAATRKPGAAATDARRVRIFTRLFHCYSFFKHLTTANF